MDTHDPAGTGARAPPTFLSTSQHSLVLRVRQCEDCMQMLTERRAGTCA